MPEHGIEPLFIVAVVVSLLMWVGIIWFLWAILA